MFIRQPGWQPAIDPELYLSPIAFERSHISPFLFNIFFNDLDLALALGGSQGITEGAFNLRSLMYADDLLLLSNSCEDLLYKLVLIVFMITV